MLNLGHPQVEGPPELLGEPGPDGFAAFACTVAFRKLMELFTKEACRKSGGLTGARLAAPRRSTKPSKSKTSGRGMTGIRFCGS